MKRTQAGISLVTVAAVLVIIAAAIWIILHVAITPHN